jgi:hypothetical protein
LNVYTLPQMFGDPLTDVVTLSSVVDYGLDGRSTVAVLATGAVKAWGTQDGGALGNNVDNSVASVATPVDVTGLQSGGTAVSSSCAVVNGAVKC